MNKAYTCYCGTYCENCAVKARVEPAGSSLYREMQKAGFEHFIHFMPDGKEFWNFLKGMAENGICTSCRDGSGDPRCKVRICAKEKGVEMCALCESYPCNLFDPAGFSVIKADNDLLREKGWEAWAKLQEERRARGFTYTDETPAGGK